MTDSPPNPDPPDPPDPPDDHTTSPIDHALFHSLDSTDRLLLHTLLSRTIITEEEALAAVHARISTPDTSLADILLHHNAITPNQRTRALAQIEQDLDSTRTRLPGFKIHEILSQTSSGTVLRATQTALDRQVAIKILPRRLASNPRAVERLIDEARKAAALEHPNIVRIYAIDHHEDCHYFVMELLANASLKQLLADKHHLPEYQALDILIPIAEALAYIHSRHLLHLDVKPGNILIANSPQGHTSGGIPKLADLGIARAITPEPPDPNTQSSGGVTPPSPSGPLGTPHYLPPEQITLDKPLTPAADIYALGATLYHTLLGTPPFAHRTGDALLRAHLTEPPPPLPDSIETGLAEVVIKCLAKSPADRYPSMNDLLTELRAWRAIATMRHAEQSRNS